MGLKKGYKETVIYIRTSTNEQNPLNQLKDCEKIIPKDQKTDTFVNYSLFEDKQSAFHDFKDREGFKEIMKLIKLKKITNMIVWDLDRIYRNRKKLIGFFQLCKIYKCKVYSYRQSWLNEISNMPYPWDETMFDFMISIFGWIAEEESLKKSERVKSAITTRKGITISKNGNKWGRKPLSTQKKNKIIKLYNENEWSMRMISKELKLSLGVVHKIVSQNPVNKKV